MNSGKYLWLLTALLFTARALPAVEMRPLPVTELSQRANLVVLGTVRGQACQRDAAGRIFTQVELSVTEVWKGTATNTTLIIYHGGGTMGNEHMEVSGQVEYAVGEEVVAFLVLNPRGEPITLGLAQGKFHVEPDAATGEKLVRNVFHGVTESSPKTPDITPAFGPPPPAGKLKLNDLKQQVLAVKP